MVFGGLLFLDLCMTFGGAPCPAPWSWLSESICDVANDLIQCETWNHKTLHSLNQHLISTPSQLDKNIPFTQAAKLNIPLPPSDKGIVDGFIDNNIPACPNIGDNAECSTASVPLALHTIGHPRSNKEPLPHKDLLSMKKLPAEIKWKKSKLC